jgi:hypothetical protein
MTDNENIEWLARVLAGLLKDMRGGWTGRARIIGDNATREPEGHSDLGALDAAAVKALTDLDNEMGHAWRVRLDLRARELWRETATELPDMAAMTRTVLVSGNGDLPDKYADQVVVQRTDTGAYYLVSTNDVETYVFPCDADGVRTDETEIPCVSGGGITRAGAIASIDITEAGKLVTWRDYNALEDDDNDQEN